MSSPHGWRSTHMEHENVCHVDQTYYAAHIVRNTTQPHGIGLARNKQHLGDAVRSQPLEWMAIVLPSRMIIRHRDPANETPFRRRVYDWQSVRPMTRMSPASLCDRSCSRARRDKQRIMRTLQSMRPPFLHRSVR